MKRRAQKSILGYRNSVCKGTVAAQWRTGSRTGCRGLVGLDSEPGKQGQWGHVTVELLEWHQETVNHSYLQRVGLSLFTIFLGLCCQNVSTISFFS